MDCTFKTLGYLPKNTFCIRCEPLINILKTRRYNKKKLHKAINQIFRAYATIKSDDILRDEKSHLKRFIAKITKIINRSRLSEDLCQIINEAYTITIN